MERTDGRVGVVTGATMGIGREIAVALAADMGAVATTDIVEPGPDLTEDIEAAGARHLFLKCDVSKKRQVDSAVQKVVERFGGVDVLVNNAGIFPAKPFLEMAEGDFDRVLDVNLKGTFNFTKAVVPSMVSRKFGNIINIASIAGTTVGFPGLVHYSASKAAIMGFTRSLALELAPYRINVNTVAPGPVDTPGAKIPDQAQYERTVKAIPLGRMGRPRDIADLVAFLAGDRSGFITGQCIVIDGGYTLQ